MAPKKNPKRYALYKEMQTAMQCNPESLGSSQFLPSDSLTKIFTYQVVADLLEEANKGESTQEYIRSVVRKALRTLAILVRINKVREFTSLYRSFNDSCLPIGTESLSSAEDSDSDSCQVASLHPKTGKFDPEKRHRVFESWDDDRIEDFEVHQWQFIPVEFSHHVFRQAVLKKRPLPIRTDNFQRIGEGHFSDVYKVKLAIAGIPKRASEDVSDISDPN